VRWPVVWISWVSFALASLPVSAADAQTSSAAKPRVEIILGGDLSVCRYAADILEDAEPASPSSGWYTSPFPDVGWKSGEAVDETYVWLDADGDGSDELVLRAPMVPYGHRPAMGTWITIYEAPHGVRGPEVLTSQRNEWQGHAIAYMGNLALSQCNIDPTCHAAIADLIPSFRVRHALPDYSTLDNYFGMIESISTPVFISLFKFSGQVFAFLRGLPRNDPFDVSVVGRYDPKATGEGPVQDLCYFLESGK
jgi:hypothetical protein